MRSPDAPNRSAKVSGFTLIEIAVVIVVLALLLAMIAGIATAMLGQQRREATRQRLAGVETALALFVSQNRRLPCPADGGLASDAAGAGIEQRQEQLPPTTPKTYLCTGNQARGVVPWITLGLSESDATDGWGGRLTYRVFPDLIQTSSLNLTYCDPGGKDTTPLASGASLDAPPALLVCDTNCSTSTFETSCTPPKTYTAGKGIRIQSASGAAIMDPLASPSTGAAYVVISHGENRKGSYSSQGVKLGEAWRVTWEDEERKNDANLALAAHFVDDFFINDDTIPRYFDDFVVRPSILTVSTKAQLGPRAH